MLYYLIPRMARGHTSCNTAAQLGFLSFVSPRTGLYIDFSDKEGGGKEEEVSCEVFFWLGFPSKDTLLTTTPRGFFFSVHTTGRLNDGMIHGSLNQRSALFILTRYMNFRDTHIVRKLSFFFLLYFVKRWQQRSINVSTI